MIVTTTPSVEGRKITDYKGIVVGEAILGANIVRDLFAGITDILGGRSGAYEQELGRARTTALTEMEERAAAPWRHRRGWRRSGLRGDQQHAHGQRLGHSGGAGLIMDARPHIERPVLTLPEPEAEALRAAYGAADTILEYGSGGSTVMAAEMPGKHVTSVESDRGWARMMRDWFRANPPAEGCAVDVVWADIGPTRDWGHPADDSAWRNFPDYPLKVWRRSGFRHPDVVLVDGRFRIGLRAGHGVFDHPAGDAAVRRLHQNDAWFAKVEEFLGVPHIIGRMAAFEVAPMAVPPDRLLQIIRFMTRP